MNIFTKIRLFFTRKITEDHLRNMTKREIGELAEKRMGVHLDRRVNKDRLIRNFLKSQNDAR